MLRVCEFESRILRHWITRPLRGRPLPPATTSGRRAAQVASEGLAALAFQVVHQCGVDRPRRQPSRFLIVLIGMVTSTSPLISARSWARKNETGLASSGTPVVGAILDFWINYMDESFQNGRSVALWTSNCSRRRRSARSSPSVARFPGEPSGTIGPSSRTRSVTRVPN